MYILVWPLACSGTSCFCHFPAEMPLALHLVLMFYFATFRYMVVQMINESVKIYFLLSVTLLQLLWTPAIYTSLAGNEEMQEKRSPRNQCNIFF